jgi:hypothetical protein
MRETAIAMRTIDAVSRGKEVADEDLKRMADAAERVVSLQLKREDERAAAMAWLKAKREKMGLAALAKMLDVDAANLGRVIEGGRRPSMGLLEKLKCFTKT